MKTITNLLCVLVAAIGSASAANIIAPSYVSGSSTPNSFSTGTPDKLTDGSGLSAPAPTGTTLVTAQTITHALDGNFAQSWVTNETLPDYFTTNPAPVLVFDLGADQALGKLLFWQYQNNGGGGTASRGNNARTIDARINTAAQGSATFSGPATTVTLASTGANNPAQTFNFSGTGRYLQLTVTDNFYGQPGITSGGGRVGLGEFRAALAAGVELVTPGQIDRTFANSVALQTIEVPISNHGTGDVLEITSIQITGLDAASFTVASPAVPPTFTLNPGADGTIQLSFNPGGISGHFAAALEIASNDPDHPTTTLPISIVVRDPWIDTAASVTIPPTHTDAPLQFDVTINNLGSPKSLLLNGAFLSGTDAAYFSVVTDFSSPLVIAPGSSGIVKFSFNPGGEFRTFSANLEFDSNDNEQSTRIVPVTASLLAPNPASMTLRLEGNSSSGSLTGLVPIAGAPNPDEKVDNSPVPPSGWRNFYYDSDGDLAFTSPGDTSGNTSASLKLNATVSGAPAAQVLNFYVDNDGGTSIGANFNGNYYRLNGLSMTLSDGSVVPLNVTQGTPQTFSDPSGKTWTVKLAGAGYLSGATTDIVGNINSIGDGQGPDYHFTLSFTLATPADFSTWAASYGIPNNVADDTDSDGIPALVEYGLGFNPTQAETLPAPVKVAGGFTVTWPKGALAAGDSQISYAIEVSSNLVSWAPPAGENLQESATQFVLTLPDGLGKTFARIRVTRAAP